MDTPLEESNLAFIGSDEDKAAREAAAALEENWEGAGESPGIQMWRVENKRDDNDNPVFGINKWMRHGEFYKGDSFIVLHTAKENDKLVWDIYFWIGSESTQDEFGVVSYKANELDKLLGDAPIQHREVEGNESPEFSDLFGGNIRVLDGGIDSGFRNVGGADSGDTMEVPSRLYQIHRSPNKVTRSFQVPLACSSLNDGDAFLLDTGNTIYTWFGTQSSPFEKERTAQMAHNLANDRSGHCKVVVDVDDDNEQFWALLGGRGEIQAPSPTEAEEPVEHSTKMYVLSDYGGGIKINEVPPDRKSLVSDDVCLVDAGDQVYVWVGKGATTREHQVSMMIVEKHLKAMHRTKTTTVTRVLEGQEGRCRGFTSVL